MSRTRLAAAVAAVAAVLALAGCSALSERTVPRSDLEAAVRQLLEEQPGQTVTGVSCDGDLPAEVDAAVRCTAEVAGDTVVLTVRATQVDGNDIRYEVRHEEPTASPAPATGPAGD